MLVESRSICDSEASGCFIEGCVEDAGVAEDGDGAADIALEETALEDEAAS